MFFVLFCRNPNWWHRRTRLEKSLVVCITIVSGIAAVFFGLFMNDVLKMKSGDSESPMLPPQATALHSDETNMNKVSVANTKIKPASENVCLTKECIHTASKVLSKIKHEVEPCDNFYEFACGTYLEEENIPDDKVSISTFSVISDKLQEQLKDIITADRPDTEPKHFRLPNLLYRACMNKSE